jgi:hypothetical protein
MYGYYKLLTFMRRIKSMTKPNKPLHPKHINQIKRKIYIHSAKAKGFAKLKETSQNSEAYKIYQQAEQSYKTKALRYRGFYKTINL